jgi:hypothetical protein
LHSLPVKIHIHVRDILSNPISILVNRSFSSGTFPSHLKIAKIVPIYKSGNANLKESYRPIAILPWMSKVYEKCMSVRLVNFI